MSLDKDFIVDYSGKVKHALNSLFIFAIEFFSHASYGLLSIGLSNCKFRYAYLVCVFLTMKEWERPKPARRPDIFPQFSPMKTPLPSPLPADPPEEDEEEEEKKEEEEGDEDPDKETPEDPGQQ